MEEDPKTIIRPPNLLDAGLRKLNGPSGGRGSWA